MNKNKLHQNTGHKRQPTSIPFHLRVACSVRECCEATSWGPDKIYKLINEGRLESRKVDKRRLILVRSVLCLLGLDLAVEPPNPELNPEPPPAAPEPPRRGRPRRAHNVRPADGAFPRT